MKVLLLQPPNSRSRKKDVAAKQLSPHIGLAYVTACLRNEGIDVAVIDAQAERLELEDVGRKIASINPDIIGISSMTHQIIDAAAVAELTKSISPKTTTVVGGAHPSALPEETLREFPAFDIAVAGEGELTMVELAKAIESGGRPEDLAKVAGISFRDGDEIVLNPPRPLISDLDSLPFPAFDLFPLDKYWPYYRKRWCMELPLSLSRGCPRKCTFCAKIMGDTIRQRKVESIIEEIKLDISKHGAEQILIASEDIAHTNKLLERVCEAIISEGLNEKVNFVTMSMVSIGRELLALMRKANFTHISFGIECGNQSILKATKKGTTLEQARRAVRWAKELGFFVDASFIIGLPYETEKTIKDTIRFACELPLDNVSFSLLVPFPNTEVRRMAERGEGGLVLLDGDWTSYGKQFGGALALENLSQSDLKRLQFLAYIKFYSKPKRFLKAIGRLSFRTIARYLAHQFRNLLFSARIFRRTQPRTTKDDGQNGENPIRDKHAG